MSTMGSTLMAAKYYFSLHAQFEHKNTGRNGLWALSQVLHRATASVLSQWLWTSPSFTSFRKGENILEILHSLSTLIPFLFARILQQRVSYALSGNVLHISPIVLFFDDTLLPSVHRLRIHYHAPRRGVHVTFALAEDDMVIHPQPLYAAILCYQRMCPINALGMLPFLFDYNNLVSIAGQYRSTSLALLTFFSLTLEFMLVAAPCLSCLAS